MNLISKQYQGYHGSSAENIDNIISSDKFKQMRRNNHWLGQGIYFFEDDKQLSYVFAKSDPKYKDKDIASIECDIRCNPDNLLNLIKQEDKEYLAELFNEFKTSLLNKRKQRNIFPKKDDTPREIEEKQQKVRSVFFDSLDPDKVKVIRCIFDKSFKNDNGKFNIIEKQLGINDRHIQLCIREQSVILNKKKVILS